MMKIKNILTAIIFTMLSSTALAEPTKTDSIERQIKKIESPSKQQSTFQKPQYKMTNVKDGKFVSYGTASWYGKNFHGRTTASGERYNMYDMTAAHNSLKFGTKVKVTCMKTGKSVVVKINDTGSFGKKYGRTIDLSYGAAKALGMLENGLTKVRLDVL